MGPDHEDERILRAKYLDWCSARVAARFLELTPDEIYQRAQRASEVSPPGPESTSVAASPDVSSLTGAPALSHEGLAEPAMFRKLIESVTHELAAELDLPDFAAWSMAYRAAPEQFDDELLGLWRESIETTAGAMRTPPAAES